MRNFWPGLLLTVSLLSCSNETTSYDGGIIVDGTPPIDLSTVLDRSNPDITIVKCSPPGLYTFHLKVYENTCNQDIVPYTSWISTSVEKSYWCGIYYSDGYSTHKLDFTLVIYCDYYMTVDLHGLSHDVRCIVYKNGTIEVCRFSYGCDLTEPTK